MHSKNAYRYSIDIRKNRLLVHVRLASATCLETVFKNNVVSWVHRTRKYVFFFQRFFYWGF